MPVGISYAILSLFETLVSGIHVQRAKTEVSRRCDLNIKSDVMLHKPMFTEKY